VVAAAGVPQRGDLPERRAEHGEGPDGHQRDDDDGLEDRRRQQGGDRRAAEAADQRDAGHRQRGAQVRADPPVEGHRAGRRPEDGAELVGGQGLHRAQPRDEQHRRQLHQPAPAHDGVDEPGGQPGQQHQQQDGGAQPLGHQGDGEDVGHLPPTRRVTVTGCSLTPAG
jgi:hypothetical protein